MKTQGIIRERKLAEDSDKATSNQIATTKSKDKIELSIL